MNYSKLKAELAMPAYASMTDTEAAAALNAVDVVRIKDSISGSKMFLSTDATEFASLTASKKSEWLSFCAIALHNPENNGVAHLFVNYVFGAGATLATLASARSETISRATQIGLGLVSEGHVNNARIS